MIRRISTHYLLRLLIIQHRCARRLSATNNQNSRQRHHQCNLSHYAHASTVAHLGRVAKARDVLVVSHYVIPKDTREAVFKHWDYYLAAGIILCFYKANLELVKGKLMS